MVTPSNLPRLGFCLLLWLHLHLGGGESPATGAVAPAETELEQLREAVRQLKAENQRLLRENEVLRGRKPPSPPPAATVPGATPGALSPGAVDTPTTAAPEAPRRNEPSPPLAPLKAPGTNDTVSAADLAAYFLADAAAAQSAFAGRSFRVRGLATGFESRPFQHSCWVELRTPDPAIRVRVALEFPMEGPPIVPAQGGNKLVIRGPNGNRELFSRGAEVVLRGKCKGSRGGSVEFLSGSIVSTP